MVSHSRIIGVLLLCLTSISFAASFPNKKQGWIDVHFHIVGNKGDTASFDRAAELTLAIMNRLNLGKVIIMSPPRPQQNFDIESIRQIAIEYPNRFAFLAGGGTLNPTLQEYGNAAVIPEAVKNDFRTLAEQYISMGAKGFGEITAHHVSLKPSHGYEWIPPDNDLMLILADVAAEHDVPIDFHFDPILKDIPPPKWLTSPKNPAILKENLRGFERLLEHNRKAKIIWAHAGSDTVGMFTPELVDMLLGKHPNLYLSVRPLGPRPNALYHPKRGFNKEWINLLKKYPDRFVLGSDSFIVTDNYSGVDAPRQFAQKTALQRDAMLVLLEHLPKSVALKIGRTNAITLYRLND